MKYENINKEYIKNHKFKNTGLEKMDKSDVSYRLSSKDIIPMSPKDKLAKLRQNIAKIVITKFDNNFKKIECDCGITENTIRKYINGSRKITKTALAKLCSGINMDIKEAEEMFMLLGIKLDAENNLFDAILVDNLINKEGILIFFEECKRFNLDINCSQL